MFFTIDPSNGVTIYEQVARQVMFAIASDVIRPGESSWPSATPMKLATMTRPAAVARSSMGNHLAAMVLMDSMVRQLPGVLGDDASAQQDSFVQGLLDCPHYTRPEVLDGMRVPEVLLSGDHAAIRRWRMQQMLGRTWLRRPDLLKELALSAEQKKLLEDFIREHGQED